MALSVVKRPIGFIAYNSLPDKTASFTNNSSVLTTVGHTLSTGETIYIKTGQAIGFWYVVAIDADNFQIKDNSASDAIIFRSASTFTWVKPIQSDAHYWNAVHNPIVYKLYSTLWPTNSVDTARTVSSYANDLGYAKLTLSGTHETTELEFVKVTFTGGTTEVYQVLTWYSTTVITINLPYRAGITFVSVQKYYSDYHARIKIYAGLVGSHQFTAAKPFTEICEIKAVPDDSGIISININEHLKNSVEILTNDLNLGTLPNNIDAFCQFYIEYAEAYTYSTGGYTLLDYVGPYTSDLATLPGYAVNAKLPFKNKYSGFLSDYVYGQNSPGKFLTGMNYPVLFATESRTLGPVSQFFDISFINIYGVNCRVKREVYAGLSVLNTYFDSISNAGIGVYRYELDRSSYLEDRIDLTVQYDTGAGIVNLTETKTITVDDSCGPTDEFIDLSWLNNLGGFDYWRFKALGDYGIDIESTTEASKNYFSDWPNSWGADADTIDFETSRKSRQTIVVRAENLSKEQAEDLAKIKTSPLVQIVNDRTDRRTVILDKSSFVYVKEGERLYSLTFNLRYTDLLPSQSL